MEMLEYGLRPEEKCFSKPVVLRGWGWGVKGLPSTGRVAVRLASSGQTPSMPTEHLGMHTAQPGTPHGQELASFKCQ